MHEGCQNRPFGALILKPRTGSEQNRCYFSAFIDVAVKIGDGRGGFLPSSAYQDLDLTRNIGI
jgi:hypothetical protein